MATDQHEEKNAKSRETQMLEHWLLWVRPIAMAFAFHGFQDQIVLRHVFELWRAIAGRTHWSSISTNIADADKEAGMLHRPQSISGAAPTLSIAELGVAPPPVGGWVPRGQEETSKVGSTLPRFGGEEWYANISNREWIYHVGDQMYFHLPTNSLWERRDQECCDPDADPHTYYRMDAVQIKVLSTFASALDGAILPLAWKAWTRYARKRARLRTTPTRESGADSKVQTMEADENPKRSNSPTVLMDLQVAEAREAHDGIIGPTEPEPPPEPPPKPPPKQLMVVGLVPATCEDKGAPGTIHSLPAEEVEHSMTHDAPELPSVKEGASKQPASGVSSAVTGDASRRVAAKAPPTSTRTDRSDVHPRKKASWFSCFRKLTRAGKVEYSVDSLCPEGMSDSMSTTQGTRGFMAEHVTQGPKSLSGWEEDGNTHSQALPNAACDASERHVRRLKRFLDDVKKNPQRLVTHVEKRRVGSTQAYFVS